MFLGNVMSIKLYKFRYQEVLKNAFRELRKQTMESEQGKRGYKALHFQST